MDSENAWKIISAYTTEAVVGPQGQRLVSCITTDTSGSSQLSAGVVVMPPGGVSKAHVHNQYEMIVFIIEGWAASLMGPELTPAVQGPGEFLFIPAGVSHLAVNLSTEERVLGIEVRADPQFNDDVELLPHLDEKTADIIADLRKRHTAGELPKDWRSQPRSFEYPHDKGVA